MAYFLVCEKCEAQYDSNRYRLFCESCGGLLDARYDTPATAEARVVAGARGTARYLPTLPINDPANLVTMGEGNTPVVPLPRVGERLGIANLNAKMEYFNPTGSFKDRGNTVQVSVLKDTGVTEVADATGGNAGHSFAAYCARAGIRFHGFANETNADSRKVHAIALHGTQMHWVGAGKAARSDGARDFAEDAGILHMNYGQNIYFIEGLKTLAYEIAEQMNPLPDHIIVPIGNGSIYQGMWRGFKEMLEDGRVDRMPRLHGAQTEETQPVVAAFEGREWTALRRRGCEPGQRHWRHQPTPTPQPAGSRQRVRRQIRVRVGREDSGVAGDPGIAGGHHRRTHVGHSAGRTGEAAGQRGRSAVGECAAAADRLRGEGADTGLLSRLERPVGFTEQPRNR